MSDQLTAPPPPPLAADSVRAFPWREQWRAVAVQAMVIVGLFAIVGVLGGLLVERLWDPPEGMVYQHKWVSGLLSIDPPVLTQNADQGVFAGVGWYAVVAIAAGLLVGALAALVLARAELVTLAAVVVGGLLCGVIMYAVAKGAGPADPNHLAATAAQGTRLPAAFRLPFGHVPILDHLKSFAHWKVCWLVLTCPGGALLSLAAVFLLVSRPKGHPGSRARTPVRAPQAG